jgi:hypothetical protein
MRRAFLLLVPLLFACSRKSETAGAAAATLTDADMAGTWKGVAMPQGSDSVIAHWTQICGAGVCRGTAEGATDTIPSTYTLMADSAVGRSQPYAEPTIPGSKVIDSWSLHIKDGKVVGTGVFLLASKPDSVLMRYRFEGSRAR